MVIQENLVSQLAREDGTALGLQAEALEAYVLGVVGSASILPNEILQGTQTCVIEAEVGTKNINFQIELGEVTPPLNSGTDANIKSVQRNSEPIIPWSRPRKSGFPKGPGSNALKKAGLRKEIAQQRILADQRKKMLEGNRHKKNNKLQDGKTKID